MSSAPSDREMTPIASNPCMSGIIVGAVDAKHAGLPRINGQWVEIILGRFRVQRLQVSIGGWFRRYGLHAVRQTRRNEKSILHQR
jgi:hypothetical protein